MLRRIRAAKTQAKRNLRWPVEEIEIRGAAEAIAALERVLPDVLRAGAVPSQATRLVPGAQPEGALLDVSIRLAEVG